MLLSSLLRETAHLKTVHFKDCLLYTSHAELRGSVLPLSEALKKQVRDRSDSLNRSGMRVLCVAQKNAPLEECSAADEAEMVLIGYLRCV